METIKKRSAAILAITVLLILDVTLFPCLIITMVVFSSYGFREFAFFAIPFVLLIIITVFTVVLLSKNGYGKQEIDPYLFHENITSTQMKLMMKHGFTGKKVYQVEEPVLLIIRRSARPDGFFLAHCESIESFAPENFADHCVESAIDQKILLKKAYGLTDANLAFLFLVEHTHTQEIQNVVKRNASKRLFHFYAFLDQDGDLHVPAFWGSTSMWEKRYRKNLKYTLKFLEDSACASEDG